MAYTNPLFSSGSTLPSPVWAEGLAFYLDSTDSRQGFYVSDGTAWVSFAGAPLQGLVSPDGNRGVTGTGVRTLLFGHSFIDGESTSGTGVLEGWSATGTVGWVNRRLGAPLQIVKEVGIGGYRLLDMISYWPVLAAVYNPALCFVSLGHNDLKGLYPSGNATAQPIYPQLAADTAQTQLPYLVAKLNAWLSTVGPSTCVVLMGESPPGQNPAGTSAGTSAQLAVRFMQWNKALYDAARRFNNVVYVPAHTGTIDPTSVIGMNVLGTLYDQVHPSIIGGFKRSTPVIEAVRRLIPPHADPLPMSAANTHSNTALTSSAAPSADGTTLTIPLSNGSTLLTVQVGDVFQLQPTGTNAADKLLAGRYTCLTATTTAITATCAATATASANMKVAISRQLFINPLMLTTTGGNAGGFSNSGTLNGTLPLGVDVSNLPPNWTLTASTEAHLLGDARDGMTTITLSLATVGSGRTATATDAAFTRADIGKLLISGTGVAAITDVSDGKTATVNITTAFGGVSLVAMAWRIGTAGYGNVLRLDLATGGSGAAGTVNINFQCSAKSASPATYDVYRKAHYGQRYQCGIEYEQTKVVGGYNGVDFQLYMRTADIATETGSTVTTARDLYRDLTTLPNTATYPFPTDDMRLTLVTPEVTPVDATTGNFLELVQGRAAISCSGANASATIRLARFGLWAVDDAVQPGRISLY